MFATHNFVFISVPKTASTTINHYLRDPATKAAGPLEISNMHAPPQQYHKTINELLETEPDGPCAEKKCFKFAFVRNPWERLLSGYTDFHILRRRHALPPFEEFCKGLQDSGWIEEIHFKPQYTFLESSKFGCPFETMSYIGRYENLQKDLITALDEREGIEGPNIKKWLSESESYRATKHAHYTEAYTGKTREIIGKLYKKDIELFEYTF